jgi:hypothetical protein
MRKLQMDKERLLYQEQPLTSLPVHHVRFQDLVLTPNSPMTGLQIDQAFRQYRAAHASPHLTLLEEMNYHRNEHGEIPN